MSRYGVVALISAFNEADIIGQVLAHLYAQGVHTYLASTSSVRAGDPVGP